jgi:hypothetical protein
MLSFVFSVLLSAPDLVILLQEPLFLSMNQMKLMFGFLTDFLSLFPMLA